MMNLAQYLKWCILCFFIGSQQELAEAIENFTCDATHMGQAKLFNTASQSLSGIVQLCINGSLGPGYASLCFTDYSLFSVQTAATVCRQIGFATVNGDKYGPASKFQGLGYPTDTKYYIVDIQCPLVHDIVGDGGLNILRCDFRYTTTNISMACGTVEQLAAVSCNSTDIYYPTVGFNGQVYIDKVKLHGGPTQPVVYMNFNNKPLPICVVGFTKTIANSVCQQLGYTGYSIYQSYTAGAIEQSWYLQNDNCNDTSLPCFTNCFDATKVIVSKCTNGGVGFGVTCIYNVTEAAVRGSGSKGLCQIESTDETWRIVSLYILIPSIGVCILGICFALGCVGYWYKKRPRIGEHMPLNGAEGERRHRQNERA